MHIFKVYSLINIYICRYPLMNTEIKVFYLQTPEICVPTQLIASPKIIIILTFILIVLPVLKFTYMKSYEDFCFDLFNTSVIFILIIAQNSISFWGEKRTKKL